MSKNLQQKERKKEEGAQFVKYFGPLLLNALRGLGGSGTPDEVVERIAQDLHIPDEVQKSRFRRASPAFETRFIGRGFTSSAKGYSTHLNEGFGV